MRARLPKNARDVFKLSPLDRILYNGLIALARLTGWWRYPAPASGDIETMTLLDRVYWLYKAQYPIHRAQKGSGLEAYFKNGDRSGIGLPKGFKTLHEIRLAATGDLMDHPFLGSSADVLYEGIDELLFGADLSMANLECVLYSHEGEFAIGPSGPQFNYGPKSWNAVKGFRNKKYGFLATACNHSLDFGEEGVLSTLHTLRSEGIAFNGVNETEEDSREATVVQRKGIKIGLVSHTFGLNARKPPKDKPWLVNRTFLNLPLEQIDFTAIQRQLESSRRQGADATVLHLHWGMEHEFYPTPDQVRVAHHLAEMGFDAIVGHHPHVVQPMESYRPRRDPSRIVPIYYSLGNLVNPFWDELFCRGWVGHFRFAKGELADGSQGTYAFDAGWTEVLQKVDETQMKIRLVKGAEEKSHVR